MRILVTGASGLLGHAVTTAFADHGHHVIALSRHATNIPASASEHIAADIRSSQAVQEAVSSADVVCHLAALVQVRESIEEPLAYWQTNVTGTLNILEALASSASPRQPKRLLLSSTGIVYGTPGLQPIKESHPTSPENPYAVTKLAADMAAAHVAATGVIGAVSLRAFNIAGATGGQTDTLLSRLIPKALAVQAGRVDQLVVNGDGSAVRDFVHADDMAAAFVKALGRCDSGQWRAYNIGSGRRTTIAQVIEVVERVTGRPLPVEHAPAAVEPPVLVADPSLAISELDWQPEKSSLEQIIGDAWSAMTS